MNRESFERVAIIGGSMAGLFAAINLQALGFNVTVFERSKESWAHSGAGIAPHDQLYNALRSAGVTPTQEMGVKRKGRVLIGREGAITEKQNMRQIMSSWGLIYRFLRAQIADSDYLTEHELLEVNVINKEKLALRFKNGSSIEADWLIGADGMNSTVRQIVEPLSQPEYAGYFAWRGLINEELIDQDLRKQLTNVITFGLAPAGHWLGYLVAGENDAIEEGRRWYNWGWYRHATASSLRNHLTDRDGRYFENGIPHHLIRQSLITDMQREASLYLAPQIQKLINLTKHPFLQGMFDVSCEKLIHGRIILIGDAAFTARPHVGLGVSKAAEDASTLAKALYSKKRKEALKRWENERKRYGQATIQWGRDLGSHIKPIGYALEADNKAEHYSSPEVLISQNASHDPSKFLAEYL